MRGANKNGGYVYIPVGAIIMHVFGKSMIRAKKIISDKVVHHKHVLMTSQTCAYDITNMCL